MSEDGTIFIFYWRGGRTYERRTRRNVFTLAKARRALNHTRRGGVTFKHDCTPGNKEDACNVRFANGVARSRSHWI